MASLLLHTCCAPCATYCIEHWQQKGLGVTAFWYNPNIHPYTEHQHRLEAVQSFAQKTNLPLIVSEGYDVIRYFREVVGREGERCGDCFHLRLSMTALIAKLKGFDAFTTTLLISPYQKHDLLKEVGEEIAQKEGVEFLYEDLRTGYHESHRMSKELDLYRQKYCGCLYSEWERFGRVKIE
ncbi:MAG TPA: epoxyqueuosine reductase QueH [Dehalococcoidia bacterium]|nr:epoxyqueuosine reductase QueH [Dehalococcoidia bacterium]